MKWVGILCQKRDPKLRCKVSCMKVSRHTQLLVYVSETFCYKPTFQISASLFLHNGNKLTMSLPWPRLLIKLKLKLAVHERRNSQIKLADRIAKGNMGVIIGSRIKESL